MNGKRLLSIDYGRKRCGVAVTDTMQIIASGLATVPTAQIVDYVVKYAAANPLEAVIVGEPRDMRGNPSESTRYITPGINRLRKLLPPEVRIERYDERFTSVLAHRAMIDGGMKRMDRRDKAVVDEISATIILNDYLESRKMRENH